MFPKNVPSKTAVCVQMLSSVAQSRAPAEKIYIAVQCFLNLLVFTGLGHGQSCSAFSFFSFSHTDECGYHIIRFIKKYPNFLLLFALFPPPLGTSAGQDKLIKYVHTVFDPDLLQCQYVKSIVFMPQSLFSQRY